MGLACPARVLVLSVCVAGVLIRALMATYHLPMNSDEANVVDRALRLFEEGPNPRWFVYPSLHLYAVALGEGLLFSARWVLQLSTTPAAFADWYFGDPQWVLVAGRTWSLATGVATLVLVYKLGTTLSSPSVGLIAAAFLAVSPTHIYYSAIVKPDAAMVLAMYSAALLGVNYLRSSRQNWPWGVGVLGGLGATLKYPGGAGWFSAPVAILLRSGSARNRLSAIIFLGVLAVIVFFAGTPFALVEPHLFFRDLAMLAHVAAHGQPGMEGLTAWNWYVPNILPVSLSLPLLFFSAFGLVSLVLRDWRSSAVVLAPALVYAMPTFSSTLVSFGYVVPLLPILCICAAQGVEICLAYLRPNRFRTGYMTAILFLCVASPVQNSVCAAMRTQGATTQELMASWIHENVRPGARILGLASEVSLPLTPDRLDQLLDEARRVRPGGGARMRFLERTTPHGTGYDFYDMEGIQPMSRTGELRVLEYDPMWITDHRFEYVIESEKNMRGFLRAPERYPLPFRFQAWISTHGELLFTTHPGSRGFPDWQDDSKPMRDREPWCGLNGEELRIYRIAQSALK